MRTSRSGSPIGPSSRSEVRRGCRRSPGPRRMTGSNSRPRNTSSARGCVADGHCSQRQPRTWNAGASVGLAEGTAVEIRAKSALPSATGARRRSVHKRRCPDRRRSRRRSSRWCSAVAERRIARADRPLLPGRGSHRRSREPGSRCPPGQPQMPVVLRQKGPTNEPAAWLRHCWSGSWHAPHRPLGTSQMGVPANRLAQPGNRGSSQENRQAGPP